MVKNNQEAPQQKSYKRSTLDRENTRRMKKQTPALLALADGTIFRGQSIGHEGHNVGELVFNTAITGYQEILTDPSYNKQIVTLTHPHIGNVGCNPEDQESDRVWAAGLVIRDSSMITSNWRATENLDDYLKRNQVVAIADIDTRQLTRILREKGAQNACLMVGDDAEKAIQLAQAFPGLAGMDLAKVVSTSQSYQWIEGTWNNPKTDTQPTTKPWHVVAYDFGIKQNILRLMVDRGCEVTVVPAQTSADDVLALHPDGVFLSNGPGDPEPCDYAIHSIETLLKHKLPLFGICLGYQLIALASGAKTIKMKFGHHGANHPIQNLATERVIITSQNHGFTVDEKSLPNTVRATHKSLFDDSLQGIELVGQPVFGLQGHPEASPGPHDLVDAFDQFVENMQSFRKQSQLNDSSITA